MAASKMPDMPPGILWMATSPPATMAAIMRTSFMMLIHAGARMPATAMYRYATTAESPMPTV